jgi:hypothetical protein
MSSNSNVLGGVVIALGLLGAFGLVGGCGTISLNNDLVSQETGIKATWRDSQVQYDTFWKKVKETAQVTDQYKEDFKEILLGAIDGRYDNQKMVMFIMEQNPQLDAAAYTQLQQVIESGRNDFAQTQRTLVDKQRRYETSLGTFPNNVVSGFLGFPKDVAGEYAPATDVDGDGKYSVLDYRTVTSEKTQGVFRSGREDEPLSVFDR